MKNVDPRISNAIAADKQKQLIIQSNIVTTGKHNGSKKKKTLLYHAHDLNNKVKHYTQKD